ncbi:MAG: AtzE family amidohydrolase [Rhodospirillales bacterium]|nr:AtzE family amidohydrolase [Rhodospirillales bacterium]
MTPIEMPAGEIARRVREGSLSALAVAETHLAQIAARNPTLNAFTDLTRERALAKARDIDARRAAGGALGPLAGVPFAVKNLFDVAGLTTRSGSKINRDLPPAAADGPLVARLDAADAVLVGALNMGEYAYDFTGENAHDGPSRNPHDVSRMSGGSSGGSGSAVAAGMVPLALGSDTNGSIRVPSSFCGLFGLKPTFGRLSRAGSFPFVASFDHLGPFARTAADLALAYDAMQGPDPADPACAQRAVAPTLPSIAAGIDGLRIGALGGYFARGGDPVIYAALDKVAKALGAATGVELPEAHRARAAAFVITNVEGAQLHLDRLRKRAADFDPATRDRLIAGNLLPAAWYAQAQRFRTWFQREVAKVFGSFDVLLAPSTPCTAPLIGQQTFVLDGKEVPLRPNIGIYTQPISFIGLPVAAVPVQGVSSLPVGVQVIAAPWREDVALRVAHELERTGICAAPVAR